MMTAHPTRFRWVLPALATALLVAQVLALGTRHFPEQVNSDDLYPYVFSQDLLHHASSVPGWTLSSAPYYFPDFTLLTLVIAATGWAGASIPTYAVFSALLLALAAGWLLKAIEPARDGAWLRGLLAVNAIVALGFLPFLDRWIWWQLAPGFHGGAVIVTVAAAALAAMEINRGPSGVRWVALTFLLGLGMASDSFVILEAVVPLTAALIWSTKDRADFVTPVRRFLGAVAVSFALLLLTKLYLAWRQIFFTARVFRYSPTPLRILTTMGAWWHDLWGERLLMTIWIVAGLFLVGLWWWGVERQSLRQKNVAKEKLERIRFLGTWTLSSAVLVVGALWFMGYWHDISNARYLVPLQTFPWIAAAAWVRMPKRRLGPKAQAGALAVLGAVLVSFAIWAGSSVRRERLVFPYPADVATLDDFCRDRHLTRGLSDYWTLHYFNTLGREGARLSALRATANSTYPASVASFWNNNVYGFLDHDDVAQKWSRPNYTFIVVNRLDEPSLRARYGNPREVVQAGPWKIWILADPAAATSRVLEDVRQRLRGRRWDAVGLN